MTSEATPATAPSAIGLLRCIALCSSTVAGTSISSPRASFNGWMSGDQLRALLGLWPRVGVGHGLDQDVRHLGADHVEVAQGRLGGALQALAVGLRRGLHPIVGLGVGILVGLGEGRPADEGGGEDEQGEKLVHDTEDSIAVRARRKASLAASGGRRLWSAPLRLGAVRPPSLRACSSAVEHSTFNRMVVSSILTGPTNLASVFIRENPAASTGFGGARAARLTASRPRLPVAVFGCGVKRVTFGATFSPAEVK